MKPKSGKDMAGGAGREYTRNIASSPTTTWLGGVGSQQQLCIKGALGILTFSKVYISHSMNEFMLPDYIFVFLTKISFKELQQVLSGHEPELGKSNSYLQSLDWCDKWVDEERSILVPKYDCS